jgi:hypothetical protein
LGFLGRVQFPPQLPGIILVGNRNFVVLQLSAKTADTIKRIVEVNTRLALIFLLICISQASLAQLKSTERAARKSMSKGNWHKAHDLIRKSLTKDSANVAAEFLFASFFFSPGNPSFNIDSAHRHTASSLRKFQYADEKELERLRRIPVDSTVILNLRSAIDSAAFERAKQLRTEEAFLHFLSQFPHAAHRDEAIVLRNEAAFLDAVKTNTYEGYLRFIEKYPSASHAEEAQAKYHLLLYEAKTRPRTLQSFELFLREYPSTPYRNVVEKNIFEIMTGGGDTNSFITYLDKFPGSSYARRAKDILFYLIDENDSSALRYLSDSLRLLHDINQRYLAPVLKDGNYGFIDENGKLVLPYKWKTLPSKYFCGGITDDVLLPDSTLTSRDGSTVYKTRIADYEDIGSGFLMIPADSCFHLIHKSGIVILKCVDDVKVIAGKFLAVRQEGKWRLLTLAGRPLTNRTFQKIAALGDVITLGNENNVELITSESLAQTLDQKPFLSAGPFNEVREWPEGRVWVRQRDQEGVLDQRLRPIIPIEVQKLRPASFGGISVREKQQRLFTHNGMMPGEFTDIVLHEPWITIQVDSLWRILHPSTATFHPPKYKAVTFSGPFAVGKNIDSLEVHLSPNARLEFPSEARISFTPGKDSTAFLLVQMEKKKSVFDITGKRIFTTEFEDVQYGGEGLFVVTQRGKKGLVNGDGKLVLPLEYDGITVLSKGTVSLLKNTKFGAFRLRDRKLIKPQYEKNLVIYRNDLLAGFERGKYRFIGWDNKSVGTITFDLISHWTDSVALIKDNFQWMLFDTFAQKIEEDGITQMKYIKDDPAIKLAIVKQDGVWGVLHNRRGFIIPPSFSAIVNVGTAEKPLYFTGKHVEEASIFVVLYYNSEGKMLMRQVYEENEYEKLICR